jgi:methionyl-tRNA formyltransferase
MTIAKRDICKSLPKIVYAGDRDISTWVLRFIIEQGIKPIAIMLPNENKDTHTKELIKLCNYLDSSRILRGNRFRTDYGINLLNELKPDYIICIHFPYIIPKKVLEIPKHGVINLHPAYLPYNRGWHTPTWAIWEATPYGATLHFMDEGIDTGDIIHQKQIEILPNDTADTLYKRIKNLEFEVFKEAWPSIVSGTYNRKPQSIEDGTIHKKRDITSIQFVDLNKSIKAGDLIRRLRALTTNNIKESAYFKVNKKLYRIQIHIVEDKE